MEASCRCVTPTVSVGERVPEKLVRIGMHLLGNTYAHWTGFLERTSIFGPLRLLPVDGALAMLFSPKRR